MVEIKHEGRFPTPGLGSNSEPGGIWGGSGRWLVRAGLVVTIVVCYWFFPLDPFSFFFFPIAFVGSLQATRAVPKLVKVYFATDRAPLPDERDLQRQYSGDYSHMTYGYCVVSVPPVHSLGELERPRTTRLELDEDPGKHFVLVATRELRGENFFPSLSNAASGKSMLLFIHGYNVSFEVAALRAAQLACDLNISGATAFFSWPSQSITARYPQDEESIRLATEHLFEFLRELSAACASSRIHIVAHSMGNRGLVDALARLKEHRPTRAFHQVILAAPDVTAELFRQLSPRMQGISDRTTLYASKFDLPLGTSEAFHRFPRAGDFGTHSLGFPGVDSIDASSIEFSFLGHSYALANPAVIGDMRQLIESNLEPDRRHGLERQEKDGHRYWKFVRLRRAGCSVFAWLGPWLRGLLPRGKTAA